MQFEPGRLRTALAAVPPQAWSLPSDYATTKVHHGYRRVGLVDAGHRQPVAEPFGFVLDTLAPVREAWLSWIDPGGFIAPHRDGGPWYKRWQVPIATAGTWVDETERAAIDGVPFPVSHWVAHAVVNDTDNPRVHLVVDRDIRVNRPTEPFTTYPLPARMLALIPGGS